MPCRYLSDTAWIGDALTPMQSHHVSRCPACARVVAAQQSVTDFLDRWTPPPVSAQFDAQLLTRIHDGVVPVPAASHVWRWRTWSGLTLPPRLPLAAAACLTVVFAVAVTLPWMSRATAPAPSHSEKVDIEQVEKVVDDMDLLRTLAPARQGASQ